MKAFFREHGSNLAAVGLMGLLLAVFLGSAIAAHWDAPKPLKPVAVAVTPAPQKTPQLSSFARLPPPKHKRKVAVEPKFEAPRQDEVKAMPMDQGWLK